jgi:hypothetical protein
MLFPSARRQGLRAAKAVFEREPALVQRNTRRATGWDDGANEVPRMF